MSQHTWKNTIEDLDKVFDTLELSIVVARALNYLSTKIECKNIIWCLEDSLNGFRKENEATVDRRANVEEIEYISQATIDDKVLEALINKFDLPENYMESTDLAAIQVREDDGTLSFLVPVRDSKTHCLLAAFVFQGVPATEKLNFNSRIEYIVKLMNRHLDFSIEYFRVKRLSFIDDVTELYNQRYLPMVLDKEISRAKRFDKPFTVLFLDIDYFKMVNDTRGHLVGSKILTEIAGLIKELIRKNDYAFRYGGDEFVIMLTETDVKNAEIVAERIRQKVEESVFKINGPELKVTVSIGLASFPEHAKTSEQVIQLADQAMYYAKNKSRNVVYVTAS